MEWSQGTHLEPNLVATVLQIESCGYEKAESGAGALGLFQVMPFHFGYSEDELDPDTNAFRGINYLQRSYELANGDIRLTLAGYNGGHSVIEWDPQDWSAETTRYVYWGRGIMQDIADGKNPSPILQEWLQTGGYSLCRDARTSLDLPLD